MTRRLAAVQEPARRAVLYVRVSALMGRVEGSDRFHSPDLQLQEMRRLIARRGLVEVDVIEDIDRTGRTFSREGLQRVMQLARDGQVDVVVVLDLSRFGRNTGESLRHIAELRQLGVSIASTTEQIDDTPEGQFMLGQFLGMAQLYSDQIGRRWQQVHARRAEQGRWHGSNPPYGYQLRPRGDGGGLVVDPAAGPWMREAFGRYAAGHLVSHIAREVGVRRGRPLAINSLKVSLRNPVYIGRLRLNDVEYAGEHEALVDLVTWEKVQVRLRRDSTVPSRRLAVSHSLVGLVFCGHCGLHLQLHSAPARLASTGKPPRPAVQVLQCRRRLIGGAEVCPGPGAPHLQPVEATVRAALHAHIDRLRSDPGARAALAARRALAGADAGRARRHLADTERALARLTVDRARREISDTAYQLAAAELEGAAALLREQVDRAGTVAGAPASREFIRAGGALLGLWEQMTVPERNRALRVLLERVEVRRAQVYREPEADRTTVLFIQ